MDHTIKDYLAAGCSQAEAAAAVRYQTDPAIIKRTLPGSRATLSAVMAERSSDPARIEAARFGVSPAAVRAQLALAASRPVPKPKVPTKPVPVPVKPAPKPPAKPAPAKVPAKRAAISALGFDDWCKSVGAAITGPGRARIACGGGSIGGVL
jgi:hypothetical protein